MKKLLYISALFSTLVCGVAQADYDDNNCANLSVMISNMTGDSCTLINSYLYSGYFLYSSSVPSFIPPGTVAGPIFLTQGFLGPELQLTYSCGYNRMITFTSKQKYCFLSAGEIYGQVEFTQNMQANYQAMTGSWFWSQHGNLNWQLS